MKIYKEWKSGKGKVYLFQECPTFRLLYMKCYQQQCCKSQCKKLTEKAFITETDQ